MDELIYKNSIIELNLFNDFINFIDRNEKTTQTYIGNLRQFAAWLKYSNISHPERSDIIAYRHYLLSEHEAIRLNGFNKWEYRTDAKGNKIIVKCKPTTAKQYLQSVCRFFRWTASEGLYPNIADNIHTPKIRQENHKKDALTANDVINIENSIDISTERGKRLLAMFSLAVNCGLRVIELHRANLKDIEEKNGIVYLYVWGKGHSEADTKKTLAPEVYKILKNYLDSRTDAKNANSPLFVSVGNRSGGSRIATTTISTMLKRALIQAGYNSERLTAHSLRHTAGTSVQEITSNLYLTQQYMRHSNPATTEIYLHNETQRQETEIARQLYNFYHKKTKEIEIKRKIESLISNMTAEQIEQLTAAAIKLCGHDKKESRGKKHG